MRRKDDEKQQRIKEAVIAVVLQEGFGGASVAKIAKQAGLSPATLYIYYENKDSMLQAIYIECAEEIYSAVLSGAQAAPTGAEKIERIMRNYFDFIVGHETLFAFAEQFAACPALTHNCAQITGFTRTMELLAKWQEDGILHSYNTVNVYALLFHPVKMLASGVLAYHTNAEAQLAELIAITQKALLA